LPSERFRHRRGGLPIVWLYLLSSVSGFLIADIVIIVLL
jgi:hypothetical protein